jgi:hypothetical protein|tara:strand:- start:175 stop:417 length:243 start_codon:yes stop_codon:yes gene_type:complete
LIENILIILGIVGLTFITWWFYFRKHMLLSKRIKNCDETLLSDSGLNIESVFQAPPGSLIHPYIIINEDTTTPPSIIIND